MKKLFREHRGGFAESLATTIECPNGLLDIEEHYRNDDLFKGYIKKIYIDEKRIRDDRLPDEWGYYCYYVMGEHYEKDTGKDIPFVLGLCNFFDMKDYGAEFKSRFNEVYQEAIKTGTVYKSYTPPKYQKALAIREDIGSQIQTMRVQLGLSVDELAVMCGMTSLNIRKIENGVYNVQIDVVGKIADALQAKIMITR